MLCYLMEWMARPEPSHSWVAATSRGLIRLSRSRHRYRDTLGQLQT